MKNAESYSYTNSNNSNEKNVRNVFGASTKIETSKVTRT